MLKVFGIYDKVEGTLVSIGTAQTSGGFIRNMLNWLKHFNPNFLNDFDLYELGSFDESNVVINPCRTLCSWGDYSIPEIPVEKTNV